MDRFGSEFGAFDDRSETGNYSVEPGYADDGAHSNPPPSPIGQDERRMQVRAYNHWSSSLGRANLPHIEDLEPEFLGDFGPYSVLLDFSTGSGTPTIQFIGRELQKECAAYDPIETLQEIPAGSLLSKIADTYLRVVHEQGPVGFEAEHANAHGKTIAYRGILLPYSSDQDTIDFVYAVINWKEVADAQTADALLAEIDEAMDYGLTEIPTEVAATPAPLADIIHFANFASTPEEEPEAHVVEDDASESTDPWDRDDNVLDLHSAWEGDEDVFDDLPRPRFGDHDESETDGELAEDDEENEDLGEGFDLSLSAPQDEKVDEPMAYDIPDAAPETPKRARLTDALGNPIGGAQADDSASDHNTGGITSAADYGLPEWDDDEEEDDVDELVNPLANIDLNSRLLSLVNSGSRGKKTVDLATLSEAQEADEEDGPTFDRSLFRPKAPSVDTLLSPEPYEEEDEDEFAEASDDAYEVEIEPEDEVESGFAPPEAVAGEVELVLSSHEIVEEEFAEPAADLSEYEEFEGAIGGYSAETVEAEIDLSTEVVELTDEAEAEMADEPFELAEIFVAEEEPVPAQAVFEADEPAGYEDVLELADAIEELPVAEYEPEIVAHQPEPGETGLTGLLAAVQELSDAARTTDDAERRALYEAVARAFDVSIKAVMASGKSSREGVEDLPLDGISRTGPDLALVMVRRHANGDTEVLGEVPHDSDLMESAQRRIARR